MGLCHATNIICHLFIHDMRAKKGVVLFFNMLKMENERDSTLTLVDMWKISLLPAAASYNDLVLDSLKPTAPH